MATKLYVPLVLEVEVTEDATTEEQLRQAQDALMTICENSDGESTRLLPMMAVRDPQPELV